MDLPNAGESNMVIKPVSSEAPAAATAIANVSSSSSAAASVVPPPLELGWTQVRRKRPRDSQEDESDTVGFGDDCLDCTDPSCHWKTASVSFQPETPTTTSSLSNSARLKGRVIWLLHDVESEWFQGYFFLPGQQSRPWGLLALIQELDECLQCSEGGYRQIRLQVHLPNDYDSANSNQRGDSKKDLGIVEWTGGDMMRLESAVVKMESDKVITGAKAAPVATDLFSGVWKQVRAMFLDQEEENQTKAETLDLLDLLPDVAVVYGTMDIVIQSDSE